MRRIVPLYTLWALIHFQRKSRGVGVPRNRAVGAKPNRLEGDLGPSCFRWQHTERADAFANFLIAQC
jgi:hypothetical protein